MIAKTILLQCLSVSCCTVVCTACWAQANVPDHEPTNAAEAALQKKYGDKIPLEAYRQYRAIVAKLPPAEAKWEHVLEDQLGGFYFPIYLKNRIKPDYNAQDCEWGYIHDNPALPRVILIGDSISRSYTVDVRKDLAGKANVHRAPANCGPTDSGLRHMDLWLDQGSGKWDVIVFNFGIHDRAKTPAKYAANLEKIVRRLEATGAKLIWARTTPFGDEILAGKDESVPLNKVSDAIAAEHHIPMADLHAAVFDRIAELQGPDHVHFKSAGIKIMADTVAQAILRRLKEN